MSPLAAQRGMGSCKAPTTPTTAVPLGLRMTPLASATESSPVILPLSPMRRVPRLTCSPGVQRNNRCDAATSKSAAQSAAANKPRMGDKRKRGPVDPLVLAPKSPRAATKPLRSGNSTPRACETKSPLARNRSENIKDTSQKQS